MNPDLSGAERGGAAEIAVGVEHRVVRRTAQALQDTGPKRELLLVAELPALHESRAGVERLPPFEAGVVAIVAVALPVDPAVSKPPTMKSSVSS